MFPPGPQIMTIQNCPRSSLDYHAALLVAFANELAGLGIDEVNALAHSTFHQLEVLTIIPVGRFGCLSLHAGSGDPDSDKWKSACPR